MFTCTLLLAGLMAAQGSAEIFFIREFVAATATAFKPDLAVDYQAIEGQAAYLAGMGIRSVFVCGTTGESMSLTTEERKAVAKEWRAAATKHNLLLVVHVGSSTPLESVELAKHAAAIGADAIASLAPFFFKPQTPADVVDVLQLIGAAAPNTPLYYYHIPSMTGVNVPVADILEEGRRVPSLRGAKFTDYDMFQLGRCQGLLDGQGNAYNILFGKDEALLGALAIGVDGAVGSTYNLPFLMADYLAIWQSFAAGNLTRARIHQRHSRQAVELINRFGSGTLKAMLELSGKPAGALRPPQKELEKQAKAALRQEMVKLGFLQDERGTLV